MPKATKTETALRNCECARYFAVTSEIRDEDGNMVDEIHESTGCTRTTKNDFAQGHDAKLKSALIAWGVAGYEVAWIDGGVRTGSDAMGVATRYGFAHMVADGIAKGVAKRLAAADRAERMHEAKAAKLTKKAGKAPVPVVDEGLTEVEEAPEAVVEPLPVPVQATAKIGRWTYEGTVNVDNTFTYRTKLGQTKTAPAGTFTVLEA